MEKSVLWTELQGRYWRRVARYFGRRMAKIPARTPYISFTYDDFPQSALEVGGRILSRFDVRGTYYVAFGLMGRYAPTGLICSPDDVRNVLARGHELGCHTFSHCHPSESSPAIFESSIMENLRVLNEIIPGAVFETLAYPIAGPRLGTKLRAGKYFRCCRGGGQTFNVGSTDLNLVKAFFLEKSRGDIESVKRVIDENVRARGWLIFATHDISDDPTPYGCTPSFFEEVVRYSVESGARVLPVARALDAIQNDLAV